MCGKELSIEDKKYLLNLARQVITARCQNKPFRPEKPASSVLLEERGAFVTLNKDGQLRGCIGYVEGIKPLYRAIINMAEAAGFKDPRFQPVDANEVHNLEIEISVLSPLKKIESTDEIEVGVHGLIMKKGAYQGLLLPQVASHYDWDRETFLDQTCIKAGMPPGCWRDSYIEIQIFSAEIFREKDFTE